VQETCDCAYRVVIVWTHDGLLTVVPLDATGAYKDKSKCASALQIISKPKSVTSVTLCRYESYSLRLDELLIKDIKFLHGQDLPTLAVLYEDNKQKKHVKTYVINLKDKELQKGPWSQPNVESGASLLHSLPRMARTQPIRSCHYATSICVEIFAGTCGGVLVFEDQSIANFKGDPKVRFNVVDCKR
jgi:DNA damage-binding protein 1